MRSIYNDFVSPEEKGEIGEDIIYRDLARIKGRKAFLPNCYIPKHNGGTTEIDLIFLHESGVYVIESKNYSGWIFGDENSKNWCETIKGKKYFFYNPIKQNKSHIKNLEKLIKIGEEKYQSVIVFNANANLKKITTESQNLHVITAQQIKKFLQEQNELPDQLSNTDMNEIYNKLLPGTQLSEEEKKQHIERIKKQYKKK